MEEEKIVLDRKSFEALAVDSRIRILKSLKERRKTLSEIAKEQKMSVSGVKEHLETLENVGLIEKKDDGHKWKYYELTRKGSGIVAPRELRVWILLSLSLLVLAASMTAMLSVPELPMAQNEAVQAPRAMGDLDAFAAKDAEAESAPMLAVAPENAYAPMPPEPQDLTLPMAIAAVSAVSLLACAGILIKNRLRRP